MKLVGEVTRKGDLWEMALAGTVSRTPAAGYSVLRLFAGEGAVVVSGTIRREGDWQSLVSSVRDLARSLRSKEGERGGLRRAAKEPARLAQQEAGDLRVSYGQSWRSQATTADQVLLVRDDKGMILLARSDARMTAEEVLAIARAQFPLNDVRVSAVGEPSVSEGGLIINEWANEHVSIVRHTRCGDDGCLSLFATAAPEYRLEHDAALLWFAANTRRAPAVASAESTSTSAPERRPKAKAKAKAPSHRSDLARRVLGQRLHYSISTAYGDDGVFVGGHDVAELHFCADGSIYGAQREELVATGYVRNAQGARRGVWAESSFLGRDALVIEWDDGGVETLALSPQDTRSTIARTLELVGPAERRKVEEALKGNLPSTIVMFRVEDGRPMMFDHDDSALCE